MIKGATETNAEADKLHHGVIEEFRATILTGNNCTSVKVKMNAKKKSIHPNIIQNIPATINPGIEFGRTRSHIAPRGTRGNAFKFQFPA